jgi:hypothetical protein
MGQSWNRLYRTAQEPVGLLLRSSYKEQPRALALGQVVRKSALKVAPDVWGVARRLTLRHLHTGFGRLFQGDLLPWLPQG